MYVPRSRYVSDGKVLGSGGFGGMFGVTKDGQWVIGTLDNVYASPAFVLDVD